MILFTLETRIGHTRETSTFMIQSVGLSVNQDLQILFTLVLLPLKHLSKHAYLPNVSSRICFSKVYSRRRSCCRTFYMRMDIDMQFTIQEHFMAVYFAVQLLLNSYLIRQNKSETQVSRGVYVYFQILPSVYLR